jgi:lipoprotein-releasing system permease protein
MRLDVGKSVYVYFINEQSQSIRARKFSIVGIYQTHLEEYDKITCFTDIYTVRKLNNWEPDQSTGVEIMVANPEEADQIVDHLAADEKFLFDSRGYERGIYKIQDLSPHIFAWLDVLDMNVVMILVLMLAIGGFTVMAGLLIVMLDRIQMIGILKSLGASNLTIRKIFSNSAVMIVGKGIVLGDIVGLGLCFLQRYASVVKLDPATYYIDTVPVELNWFYILLVNIGVLVISSVIIFGSSFLMSIKGPSTTMRWE